MRCRMQSTGTVGEFVAGVRYKAWSPPSALHPSIGVHVPLVFDIVDTWMKRSVGGCQYHVAHPGGLSYESFPVNAYEAESRRLSRFVAMGHTPGQMHVPAATIDVAGSREFPFTLDLRRASVRQASKLSCNMGMARAMLQDDPATDSTDSLFARRPSPCGGPWRATPPPGISTNCAAGGRHGQAPLAPHWARFFDQPGPRRLQDLNRAAPAWSARCATTASPTTSMPTPTARSGPGHWTCSR
jgi:hypothetical protein